MVEDMVEDTRSTPQGHYSEIRHVPVKGVSFRVKCTKIKARSGYEYLREEYYCWCGAYFTSSRSARRHVDNDLVNGVQHPPVPQDEPVYEPAHDMEELREPHSTNLQVQQNIPSSVCVATALETLLARGQTDVADVPRINDILYQLANVEPCEPGEQYHIRRLYDASDDVREALDDEELTSDEEDQGPEMRQVMSQPNLHTASDWYKVGMEAVMANAPDSRSVWGWSAMMLAAFLQGSITFATFEVLLKNVPKLFKTSRGACSPHNPNLRFPQSKKAVEACLGVPPLQQYEIHVCWNDRCTHWWPYLRKPNHHNPEQNRPCTGRCKVCVCPCCGEPRWRGGRKKGVASRCYFFPSVLDQFFLDDKLCLGILAARHAGTATFHKTARYQHLVQSCTEHGLDKQQMMCLEIASDGGRIRGCHTTVQYLVRCLDAPAELMMSRRNVKPLLIVPGPRAPKDSGVYWCIILEWLTQMLNFARNGQGTPFTVEMGVAEHKLPDYVQQHLEPPVDGNLPRMRVQPVFMTCVADWMERIKTFKMLGPCANHPAGFNMHIRRAKVKHEGREVAIAGVTRKIVQPFLGGAEDYVTASELHLSLEEFEEAGSIAARNERLLERADLPNGVTRAELKDVRTQLGRYGKVPWLKKRYQRMLPYMHGMREALMPISHMLLHGPLKDFFQLGLWGGWIDGNLYIFSGAQLKDVDDMDPRICLPHCHCRTYKNIRKYIGNYTIEELANLIWIGGLFAELGPPGFQKLWCYLRPALQHYVYGRGEYTQDHIDHGHKQLWEYAAEVERAVLAGRVPSRMLKPNLLVALCMLPRQEEIYNEAANFNELYMERAMNAPHQHPDSGSKTNPEVTFVGGYIIPRMTLARVTAKCRVLGIHLDDDLPDPDEADEEHDLGLEARANVWMPDGHADGLVDCMRPSDSHTVSDKPPPGDVSMASYDGSDIDDMSMSGDFVGQEDIAHETMPLKRNFRDPRWVSSPRILPYCVGAGPRFSKLTRKFRQIDCGTVHTVVVAAHRLLECTAARHDHVPVLDATSSTSVLENVQYAHYTQLRLTKWCLLSSTTAAEVQGDTSRITASSFALAELPRHIREAGVCSTDCSLQPVLIRCYAMLQWPGVAKLQRVAYVKVLPYVYRDVVEGSGQRSMNIINYHVGTWDHSDRQFCILVDSLKRPVAVVKPEDGHMRWALAQWRLIPFEGKGLGIDYGMGE